MPRTNRYSPEVRERAVRMVAEHRDEYPSEWAAFTSISAKLGMTPETLRVWVRRAQVDDGKRPGLTTDERQKLKDLEKEVKELRCPWPDFGPRFWPPKVPTPQSGCSGFGQRRSVSLLTRFLHAE